MATPFQVEVVTPERVLFSGEAEEVSLRTDEGEISFLAKHEDFIGAVDITLCRIVEVGGDIAHPLLVAVHGGFVLVNDDGVKLLAGVAELGSEIDVERARAALSAAQGRVGTEPESHGDETPEHAAGVAPSPAMLALLEPDAPEQAVRRAEVRLEAAGAVAHN